MPLTPAPKAALAPRPSPLTQRTPPSNETRTLDPNEPAAKRRPARDPVDLAAQLARELGRLVAKDLDEEAKADARQLVRAYLLQSHTLAWRGVHRGDLMAPMTVLAALREVRPYVDRFLPNLDENQQIATEIEGTFAALVAANRALERLRTEARLADPEVSRNERSVLEVLACVEDDLLLRRNQIYERMAEPKPTLARVGQMLKDLHAQGYLTRQHASARGNARTAYYGLSALGRGLCERTQVLPWLKRHLNLPDARLTEITLASLQMSFSLGIGETEKRIAHGMLCTMSLQQPASANSVLMALYNGTVRYEDEKNAAPVEQVFRQVAQSRIGVRVLEKYKSRGCFRVTDSSGWRQVEEILGSRVEILTQSNRLGSLSSDKGGLLAALAKESISESQPSNEDLLRANFLFESSVGFSHSTGAST